MQNRLHKRCECSRRRFLAGSAFQIAGHIFREMVAPFIVQAGQLFAEVVAAADLRQKRILQRVKLRHIGRIQQEHCQKVGQMIPSLSPRAAGLAADSVGLGALVQHLDEAVEHGQQNVFLGGEIVGELTAAHACFFLYFGKR